MTAIAKIANIYTNLQNTGSQSSGQFLDRGSMVYPEKRGLNFKDILKNEISKSKTAK